MEFNEDLFNRYVTEYGDMVYRIACTRTGNVHDAEDITQDVFEKLFLHMKKDGYFRDETHVRSWLAAVAANAGVSKLREAFGRKRADLTDDISFTDGEYEKKELLDCVFRLDKKYSTVVYLFYYESYSVNELAKMLKITPSAVKSRLDRAREQLKTIIGT